VKGRASIAELRFRARSLATERELFDFVAELERDSRRAASALAAQLRRAIDARRRESARLAHLFARTRELERLGARAVAGVDEVGVGPLAGPLVAAAVILRRDAELSGLDDSKQLSRAQREALALRIRAQSIAVGVAEIPPAEVDRLNVYRAGLEAMRRAVLALAPPPDHVLVDARTIPGIAARQTAIIGGDAREAPIAAASIVAKVHRDALMRAAHERHPEYGFDRHMGYATVQHLAALRRFGPTALHRRSTAPVAQAQLAFGAGT
jgi:ribonuclease HII